MHLTRVLLHAAVVLVGAVVALGAVAVHRSMLMQVPWGLVLALATTFAVLRALHHTGLRTLGATYTLGWLVVCGAAVLGRPEGDYVLAGDLRGYGLMAGSFALCVLGVASLAPARVSRRVGPAT